MTDQSVFSPGERARALITAHVGGDPNAGRTVLGDLPAVELAAVSGALLAYCGNLLSVAAALWGVDSAKAWEVILHAEREVSHGA